MRLEPFLLDHWLDHKFASNPGVEFDLGSSTGPQWSLRELLELAGDDAREAWLETTLHYSSPAGREGLRHAIADYQGVQPDHVLATTGASEALHLLMFLAAEPGANVIVPQPCFTPMSAVARSYGLEVRPYRLRAEDDFRVDLREIEGLVDRHTGLVLVNSPHNPTGSVIGDEEMESLHAFCAERRIQLVVDEVYHPIYFNRGSRSAARLPQATVLGDLSKAFCLSGLRVGWIVERDPVRRAQYIDARSYFTISNAGVCEALAALAVHHRESIHAGARRVSTANVELLDRFMAAHGDLFGWVRPRGGMTAFPWLRDLADSRPFCEAALQHGLLIVPGDCFGMPRHLRIGFAAAGDRFAEALERLEALTQSFSATVASAR